MAVVICLEGERGGKKEDEKCFGREEESEKRMRIRRRWRSQGRKWRM